MIGHFTLYPSRTVARKFSVGGLYVCSGVLGHSEIWWKVHRFTVLHNSIWGSLELWLGG